MKSFPSLTQSMMLHMLNDCAQHCTAAHTAVEASAKEEVLTLDIVDKKFLSLVKDPDERKVLVKQLIQALVLLLVILDSTPEVLNCFLFICRHHIIRTQDLHLL